MGSPYAQPPPKPPQTGTAPRRVTPGVWVTRSGRKLTPQGSAYWERQYRAGHADGMGRFGRASVVFKQPKAPTGPSGPQLKQPSAPVKKPSFGTFYKASRGDQAARAKVRVYTQHQGATKQAKADVQAATDRQFGTAIPLARAASKTVSPAAAAVIKSLSPSTALEDAYRAGRKGNVPSAALSLASIFPVARGPKALEEGIAAGKAAAKAGEAAMPAEVIPNAVAEKGRRAVLDVLPAADERYAQIEALRKVERARREAMIGPAFEQAGGGMAGHAAASAALKGQYTALGFDDLAGQLDDTTMNAMFNAIHEHTALRGWEKKKARDALIRLQDGNYLRPHEVTLLHKTFGPELTIGPASTKKGVLEYVSDIVNIPRALMATGEFSYRLRNGLLALAMHPLGGIKTTGKALTGTFSQAKHEAMLNAIFKDPELSDLVHNHGLEITDVGGSHVIGREEAFASPMAEKITGGKYSPVRAAGRVFTANADLDRAMVAKSLLDLARKTDTPIDAHLKDSIVRVALTATGRSPWGHDRIEMLTNTFLFAPKLLKSHLDPFNPLYWKSLHPLVRKQLALGLVRLVAAGVGTLAVAAKYGLNVELDPRSTDFGKIRSGKTRFDIWGGNQQLMRTVAQLGMQATKSSTTGKIHPLGHGQHFDPLGRFFEGKLSPPFSLALDVKRGEMFAGRPLTLKNEAKEKGIPLWWQDIWDAWHQSSLPVTGAVIGTGMWGVGTQTYSSQKPKPTTRVVVPGYTGSAGGSGSPYAGTGQGRSPYASP